MIQIEYPNLPLRIEVKNDVRKVFCLVRKKWIVLTPEEWVRQHFLSYLIHTLKYPVSLIAVEKLLKVGTRNRRTDIVVYKDQFPFLLIECKHMDHPLTNRELDQTLHYFSAIQCPYWVITNGAQTHGYLKTETQLQPLSVLPEFDSKY